MRHIPTLVDICVITFEPEDPKYSWELEIKIESKDDSMIIYGYETSKMADTKAQTMMNSGEQLELSTIYTSFARNGASIVVYPNDYISGELGEESSFRISY